MTRTADYSIQGFIYQFVVTLHKLLSLSDGNSELTIEGPIEDIDITTPIGVNAIQCKYHEAKDKFVLSSIYRPVLQMMNHFHKNSSLSIRYKLFAHFPTETVGTKRNLTKDEISQILASKTRELQSLIADLVGFSDIDGFISKFEIEFGPSLSDLQKVVVVSLSAEGISTEDAEEIFYPNAIHKIAELSIKHDDKERKIKKSDFILELKKKKKTAITRWTRELLSNEKLLKKRKEQLRDGLNKNLRKRAILMDSGFIEDFDKLVVQFLEDFVNKYNSKIRLHNCPIISIIGDEKKINEIWKRLNAKGITVERGTIAEEFNLKHFLREPIKSTNEGRCEFRVKLCNYATDFKQVLMEEKFDDIFLITNKDFDFENDLMDTNIEKIETNNFNELRYLLSLNEKL